MGERSHRSGPPAANAMASRPRNIPNPSIRRRSPPRAPGVLPRTPPPRRRRETTAATTARTPNSSTRSSRSLPRRHYQNSTTSSVVLKLGGNDGCEEEEEEEKDVSSNVSDGSLSAESAASTLSVTRGRGDADCENYDFSARDSPSLEGIKLRLAQNRLRRDSSRSESLMSILSASSQGRAEHIVSNASFRAVAPEEQMIASATLIYSATGRRGVGGYLDKPRSGAAVDDADSSQYKVNLAPRIAAKGDSDSRDGGLATKEARPCATPIGASLGSTKNPSASGRSRETTAAKIGLSNEQGESSQSTKSSQQSRPSQPVHRLEFTQTKRPARTEQIGRETPNLARAKIAIAPGPRQRLRDVLERSRRRDVGARSDSGGGSSGRASSLDDPFFERLRDALDSFRSRGTFTGGVCGYGGKVNGTHAERGSGRGALRGLVKSDPGSAPPSQSSILVGNATSAWMRGRVKAKSDIASSTFSVSPITEGPGSKAVRPYIGPIRLDSRGNFLEKSAVPKKRALGIMQEPDGAASQPLRSRLWNEASRPEEASSSWPSHPCHQPSLRCNAPSQSQLPTQDEKLDGVAYPCSYRSPPLSKPWAAKALPARPAERPLEAVGNGYTAQSQSTNSSGSNPSISSPTLSESVESYIGTVGSTGSEGPEACSKCITAQVVDQTSTGATATAVIVGTAAPRFTNTVSLIAPASKEASGDHEWESEDASGDLSAGRSSPLVAIDDSLSEMTPDEPVGASRNEALGVGVGMGMGAPSSPLQEPQSPVRFEPDSGSSSGPKRDREGAPISRAANGCASSVANSYATSAATSSTRQDMFDMLRNTFVQGDNGEDEGMKKDSRSKMPPVLSRPPLSPIPVMHNVGTMKRSHPKSFQAQLPASKAFSLIRTPNGPSPMVVRGTPIMTPHSNGASTFFNDENTPNVSATREECLLGGSPPDQLDSFLAHALVATNILSTPKVKPKELLNGEKTTAVSANDPHVTVTQKKRKCDTPPSSRGRETPPRDRRSHQELSYASIGATTFSTKFCHVVAGKTDGMAPLDISVPGTQMNKQNSDTKNTPSGDSTPRNRGHSARHNEQRDDDLQGRDKDISSEDNARMSESKMRDILSIASALEDTDSIESESQATGKPKKDLDGSSASQGERFTRLAERVQSLENRFLDASIPTNRISALEAYLDGEAATSSSAPDPVAGPKEGAKSQALYRKEERKQCHDVDNEKDELRERIYMLEQSITSGFPSPNHDFQSIKRRLNEAVALKEEALRKAMRLETDLEKAKGEHEEVAKCLRQKVEGLLGELVVRKKERDEIKARMERERSEAETGLRKEIRYLREELEEEKKKKQLNQDKELLQRKCVEKELVSCARDNDALRGRIISLASESEMGRRTLSTALSQLKSLSENHYHVVASLEKEQRGRREEVFALQTKLDDASREMIELNKGAREVRGENERLKEELRKAKLERARSTTFHRSARGYG